MQENLWIIYFFGFCIYLSSANITLEVSTHDVTFESEEHGVFTAYLSNITDKEAIVGFKTVNTVILEVHPAESVISSGKKSAEFNITAHAPGLTTLELNVTPNWINADNAFVRVSVYKIKALQYVSSVIGWLYFVAWSVSFYPQIYTNWKRKSVVGLNFDFLGLNITGFIAYSIFNIGLYFIPIIQKEYHELYPTTIIPVEINDVVFAVHAAIATLLTIVQCFIYERGNQAVSKLVKAGLVAIWLAAIIFLIVIFAKAAGSTPWLTYMYFFSYVKLGITLTKYIPQAFYNFKRKSTEGWSIGTVLTDFAGGILSILQMFVIAYNFDTWLSMINNFTKFGIGVISIGFDTLFMIQHYILYPNDMPYYVIKQGIEAPEAASFMKSSSYLETENVKGKNRDELKPLLPPYRK